MFKSKTIKSFRILDELILIDDYLILKLKNKSIQKIPLHDIHKAYIISNRKSNDLKMILLVVPLFLLLFFDEIYFGVLFMVIIVLYLFTKSILYNVKSKLIIEFNDTEKLELKFKNDIKYKIIETLSLIRKTKS